MSPSRATLELKQYWVGLESLNLGLWRGLQLERSKCLLVVRFALLPRAAALAFFAGTQVQWPFKAKRGSCPL